jgi:L-2-hydroxyglutarate oxidase LhgO
MNERLDCVIVGAGVVGLAIARSLAKSGREVLVLEAESQIGMHASSRNSEVIHAGLYYPEGSLKARLCVSGKEMLYRYCATHQVSHQRIGKLIIAAQQVDISKLQAIERQARLNGVDDVRFLDAAEIRELEPDVVGDGALWSPSTGIVDSHQLMMALQAEIETAGGMVVLNSKVTNLVLKNGELQFDAGGETFFCKTLVNAAGLWAQELVSQLQPLSQTAPLPTYYAKGHYFSYQGRSPFQHLVYPLPFDGGLGIHATNDLSGAVRFGPDVTWVDEIDYDFDESRKPEFVKAIKAYFPGLDETKLLPAYTGIRSKLAGPRARFTDFEIQFDADHGVPGLVNLMGIESPGLSACLAIAEFVQHNVSR